MAVYKAYDYRKVALSNKVIQGRGTKESPYPVDYMFVEVNRSTKKVTDPVTGVVTYVGIAPNPDGVKNLKIINNVVRLVKPLSAKTSNIAFGVIIRNAEDTLIENNEFSNFTHEPIDGYENGDAISLERGAVRTIIRGNYFHDDSDGGIDSKGLDTISENNLSERNYRNYRWWDGVNSTDDVSRDPRNAHHWFGLASSRKDIILTRPQFWGGPGKAHLKIDHGRAGRKITLVDPIVDGVKVTNLNQMIISKVGTGKNVEIVLVLSKPDIVGDIYLATKFKDSNNDDIIEFGKANQAIYGCKKVKYLGQNLRGQYVYGKL